MYDRVSLHVEFLEKNGNGKIVESPEKRAIQAHAGWKKFTELRPTKTGANHGVVECHTDDKGLKNPAVLEIVLHVSSPTDLEQHIAVLAKHHDPCRITRDHQLLYPTCDKAYKTAGAGSP